MIENQRALLALQTAKFEAARLARLTMTTFTASTMEELETATKAAIEQVGNLKSDLAKAIPQLTVLNVSGNSVSSQFERLSAVADKVLSTARDGGNIKALAITGGEGRKVFNETLGAFDDYVKFINKRMAEIAAAGTEEASFAKLLLISVLAASMLIAVASATWIAVNISRGLGRAVGLADAVAAGDLTRL
jgi:methyl-accepting chemotaxis protein